MLKQRIITALLLLPVVFAALWLLPTFWVAIVIGALMVVSAWEWSLFIPLQKPARVAYAASAGGLMLLAHPALFGATVMPYVLVAGLLWWLLATLWLFVYPAGFGPNKPAPWLRGVIGLLAVLPCYVAFWSLHAQAHGRELIFLLLFLVWATDTGGYFAGKQFGRMKLAPMVSPKKTWEGLIGGVLLAVVLAVVAALFVFESVSVTAFALLGLGVALMSIVGDLMISMFKRQTGIKDTGNLFPGHGGALDRLDSLLSAAPIMLAAWLYLVVA